MATKTFSLSIIALLSFALTACQTASEVWGNERAALVREVEELRAHLENERAWRMREELAKDEAVAKFGALEAEAVTMNRINSVRTEETAEARARLERARELLGQCSRGVNRHPFCPGCGKRRDIQHGSWCPIDAFLAEKP